MLSIAFLGGLGQPAYVAAAEVMPLVWRSMEATDSEDKAPDKAEEKKQGTDSKPDNVLATAIAEIQRKRQEEDKMLVTLMAKQQEQETKKAQEQQQLFSAIASQIEKQKQEKLEADQKLASVLAELQALRQQQAEQQQQANEQQRIANEQQQKSLATLTETLQVLKNTPTVLPISNGNPDGISIESEPVRKPIQELIKEHTQDGSEAPARETDVFFSYSSGALYQIYCRKGFITDIQFQPGEELLYVGGGDTTRWVLDRAQSGSGETKKTHLYIKPVVDTEITTNIIVTTDKRSYHLQVKAVNWYNPIVRWVYPEEQQAALVQQQKKREELTVLPTTTMDNLSFDYKISGKSYDWKPTTIFNDGVKTYIKMPASMFTSEAPVLFIKDADGNLAMVNYRLKNGCYIVDKLFNEAEMRNGKQIIKIKRKKP